MQLIHDVFWPSLALLFSPSEPPDTNQCIQELLRLVGKIVKLHPR